MRLLILPKHSESTSQHRSFADHGHSSHTLCNIADEQHIQGNSFNGIWGGEMNLMKRKELHGIPERRDSTREGNNDGRSTRQQHRQAPTKSKIVSRLPRAHWLTGLKKAPWSLWRTREPPPLLRTPAAQSAITIYGWSLTFLTQQAIVQLTEVWNWSIGNVSICTAYTPCFRYPKQRIRNKLSHSGFLQNNKILLRSFFRIVKLITISDLVARTRQKQDCMLKELWV